MLKKIIFGCLMISNVIGALIFGILSIMGLLAGVGYYHLKSAEFTTVLLTLFFIGNTYFLYQGLTDAK